MSRIAGEISLRNLQRPLVADLTAACCTALYRATDDLSGPRLSVPAREASGECRANDVVPDLSLPFPFNNAFFLDGE